VTRHQVVTLGIAGALVVLRWAYLVRMAQLEEEALVATIRLAEDNAEEVR